MKKTRIALLKLSPTIALHRKIFSFEPKLWPYPFQTVFRNGLTGKCVDSNVAASSTSSYPTSFFVVIDVFLSEIIRSETDTYTSLSLYNRCLQSISKIFPFFTYLHCYFSRSILVIHIKLLFLNCYQ